MALANPSTAAGAIASPADWQQIFALLDTALELDPAAQPRWLDTLPPAQAHLSPLLKSLLQAHAQVSTGDFLQSPPTFAFDDAPARFALAAGTLVGPYRLLREIGQGGMASVWLAERADGLLERRIALKLPHLSWGAAAFADRMARERNILGSLTHPNIARLYDAGLADDGRPFLALEYVDGEPIDAFAKAKDLTVRARVELIVQVARAVAHAHARLVVHRDLKPSNILVDAAGQAHLLDFGIAKLVDPLHGDDAAAATQMQGRALTPDYASPEQVRGDAIGTASDIYSLGVVMFELLAGERPYRLKRSLGPVALVEAIEQAAVPRVSAAAADPAVQRQLAGDLDAIVARTLAKVSTERYATIDALADDLERHLRGEPVRARPDSRWYLAERWVRRHKVETAVAAAIIVAVPAGAVAQAAVLVAIGIGAAVALWQMREARRQAEAAKREAERADEVKDFVLSILHGASTDAGAGAATTATDVLKSARKRIDTELAGRPAIKVELLNAIGFGLFGLGQLADADAAMRQALELANRELGARHPHTVAAMVISAFVLVDLDRPKEAVALLVPAVAEAKRQNATHTLIDALCCLATLRIKENNVEDGLACAQAAVDALTEPGATPRPLDAASAWVALASMLDIAKRPGVADAARKALAHVKALHGDRVVLASLSARTLLAKGLATEGHDAAALIELDSVIADTIALLGPAAPDIAWLANHRGNVRLDTGDTAGAIEDFRWQLALYEGRGDRGSNPGLGHSALARALAAARCDEEALNHFATCARLLHDAIGPGSWFALRALSSRGFVLTRLGRLDEAEREFDAIADASWAGGDLDRAAHAARLSVLRSRQGRHDEAITLARSAVEGLRSHTSKIVRAAASSALGHALLAAGRPGEAVEPLQEAVRLFEEKQLHMSPDRAEAVSLLAAAQAASKSAVPCLVRSADGVLGK
jgi:eukaryotic-like serine/threonine-protein kinase